MKINLKKIGVEAEANVEKIIEKGMDNHEKDWKEKHNAKKEILELKHRHKMEEQSLKNGIKLAKKNGVEYDRLPKKQEEKSKTSIKAISIILFFIYGLFCIVGFKDEHIISAIISLIQTILVTISIFSAYNLLSIFKNDYKMCLVISILLIVPWLAFAV